MFKLIHKNRKGFSITELMVTVVVLGLLIPLAGGLLYNITNFNNVAVDRWDVQTAVNLVCSSFENNKDGLTNAYQADLIYDPVIEDGVILNADNTITWVSGSNNKTIVMDAEGTEHTGVYTYIFSARTWRNDGNGGKGEDLGELLYIRDYKSTNSALLLNEYGLGNVPVSVDFSIGTTENLVPETEGTKPTYTNNTVTLHFSSGKNDFDYSYNATFAIVNILSSGRPLNYSSGKLSCEDSWLDANGNPLAYVSGWTNYSGNISGFPTAATSATNTPYYETNCEFNNQAVTIGETYQTDSGATEPVITRKANLMRYKSPAAEKEHVEALDQKSNTNIAGCLTGFAMMGSDMEDQVLGSLRMFRDNVLRGTKFGDWFIHEYYYTWSPFLIEYTAFLKPVYKAILIPISYICGFIARL